MTTARNESERIRVTAERNAIPTFVCFGGADRADGDGNEKK